MRAWSEFIPNVMPFVPGCPEFEVENRLRKAAIEFCERSRIWRARGVTLVTSTVAGQTGYTVPSLPVHAGLCHIFVAWRGTDERDEVRVLEESDADDIEPTAAASRDFGIMLTSRSTLNLLPPPDSAGIVVRGSVAYCPSDDADGVPNALFVEWREAIEKRAIAELMLQPGKPWSSGDAMGHMGRADKLLNEAANKAGPVRRAGHGLRVRSWG
jgi:hypothetical protein